jgi:hypothetical protein
MPQEHGWIRIGDLSAYRAQPSEPGPLQPRNPVNVSLLIKCPVLGQDAWRRTLAFFQIHGVA